MRTRVVAAAALALTAGALACGQGVDTIGGRPTRGDLMRSRRKRPGTFKQKARAAAKRRKTKR